MQTLDLAIIIPTLNEERYIGKLLDSIAFQTAQPKEVVVVDAYSSDATIKVIKKYQKKLPQLKYFQIPKFTISRQRNFGASQTTAKHLLFLDADMLLLDPYTLDKYLTEIELKRPDIAAATNYPDSDYWKDRSLFRAMDLTFKTLKPVWPMAQGMNIYVSRKHFNKIGGYDESIKVGEDHEIVQRATKKYHGKLTYLSIPQVYTSVRRIQKMGHLKYASLMTLSFILDHSFGYRRNPMAKFYGLGEHLN